MTRQFMAIGCALAWISTPALGQTYTQFNAVPIPDLTQSFTWDMVVTDDVTIGDLNAGLMIQYTWQGDLIIRLIHLDTGTTAMLVNRPGGTGNAVGFSTDNYGNLTTGQFFVLDDEAATVYDTPFVPAPGIANVTGHWKPDGPPTEGVGNLGVFDGESIQGTWRVFITDHAAGDVGFFHGLQLQVSVPSPSGIALLGVFGLLGRRRRG